MQSSIDEKVNRWPIITLIATAAGGLLVFSVLQFNQKKAAQESEVHALETEHEATTTVMRKIGQDSLTETQRRNDAAQKAYENSPQRLELKRLEAEDIAAAAAPRPPSPPPPASTSH